MKKKNTYPKHRKPAALKPCPICAKFFPARGLHRHILLAHQIKVVKEVKLIRPGITRENEAIPKVITRIIQSNPSITSNSYYKDNSSNLIAVKESENDVLPKKLIQEKREAKYIKSFEECKKYLLDNVLPLLKELAIDHTFGKADLREELQSICPQKWEINFKCYTGQYVLSAGIYYDSLTSKSYRVSMEVKELQE